MLGLANWEGELRQAEEILDPKALTIGFARRFATYKRAPLFFFDIERANYIETPSDIQRVGGDDFVLTRGAGHDKTSALPGNAGWQTGVTGNDFPEYQVGALVTKTSPAVCQSIGYFCNISPAEILFIKQFER